MGLSNSARGTRGGECARRARFERVERGSASAADSNSGAQASNRRERRRLASPPESNRAAASRALLKKLGFAFYILLFLSLAVITTNKVAIAEFPPVRRNKGARLHINEDAAMTDVLEK
jgi:hypothetical protein